MPDPTTPPRPPLPDAEVERIMGLVDALIAAQKTEMRIVPDGRGWGSQWEDANKPRRTAARAALEAALRSLPGALWASVAAGLGADRLDPADVELVLVYFVGPEQEWPWGNDRKSARERAAFDRIVAWLDGQARIRAALAAQPAPATEEDTDAR